LGTAVFEEAALPRLLEELKFWDVVDVISIPKGRKSSGFALRVPELPRLPPFCFASTLTLRRVTRSRFDLGLALFEEAALSHVLNTRRRNIEKCLGWTWQIGDGRSWILIR